MDQYNTPTTDRELDWDSEINQDAREIILLPEGDYPFQVVNLEKARHTPKPDSKIPPCNKAILTLRITADGQLAEASLHGKPIDPTAKYRIATLDYLAQGNDKLVAFKAKTDVVSPQDEHNNVRYIIMDYFREHQNVGAAKEGRIIVNP